jgi:hypothetical protein
MTLQQGEEEGRLYICVQDGGVRPVIVHEKIINSFLFLFVYFWDLSPEITFFQLRFRVDFFDTVGRPLKQITSIEIPKNKLVCVPFRN